MKQGYTIQNLYTSLWIKNMLTTGFFFYKQKEGNGSGLPQVIMI